MLLWFCVLYFEKTSEWKSLRLFFVHVSQSFRFLDFWMEKD